MTITLYKISDDPRQLDKTLNSDTKLVDLTAHYKADVDVLHPVLELAYTAEATQANYVHVPEWNRYYFVRNIKTGTQRLYLECDIDVLTTYKNGIRNLTCVIARQEDIGKSQLYMPDTMFKLLQPKDVVPMAYSKSFDSTGSFVLAVGGDV